MRRAPLKRSSIRQSYRDTGPDLNTVRVVMARAFYCCEVCDVGLRGQRGVDYHLHHRRARKMGGTSWEGINLPSNLIAVCPFDHADIESRRAHALAVGRLVPSTADPAEVAVLLNSRWVYLTNDGQYSLHPPVRLA